MISIKLELPEHFLETEIREGFSVSSDMKKVWAVELDLLNEFSRVCKKHDIMFYAAGGTLLGAVRHRGYIPWDDDIDLMMMRSEYNRLCEIASKEFKFPYFFQTEETDHGGYRGHAQLRNSETTGILKCELHQKRRINQGIFIDIFPLDYVPDDSHDREIFLSKIKWYNDKCYEEITKIYPYQFIFRKNVFALCIDYFKHLFASKTASTARLLQYYYEKEKMLSNDGVVTHHLLMAPFCVERFIYSVTDFQGIAYTPFEMLSIPIPVNYEAILNKTYGDWKKFVIGGSVHGDVLFDTETPYTEYFK